MVEQRVEVVEQERCGRCGRSLGHAKDGVHYCERCLHEADVAGSRGLWRATGLMLVALTLFGVVLGLLGPTLSEAITGTGRLLLGLVLTLVPAVLWMMLFYSQDRLEPEPHSYVISLFVLGILLGGAIEQPLLRQVYQVQRWTDAGSLGHLVSATLLNGILTAALTYLAVRFTVFASPEFDERIDGIIYGTAAALGLGVAANLAYLLEQGTISLGVGTLTLIVTSLAYATFGAIVGYFLGLIRPGGGPSWLAPLGVIVAGVTHGAYEWLAAQQIGDGSLGYNPWISLIVTSIFALIVFGIVFALIRRTYRAMVLPVASATPTRGG